MKKAVYVLLFFLLFTAFAAAPKNISAYDPPPEKEVWEWYGDSVIGQEIPMYTFTSTPREWYQLMANGLKVDGPTQICHEFDQGRYGWTGVIFQWGEGEWVKMATTVGWVPTEEGRYMACAKAPAAGTYAMFGYWQKPEVEEEEEDILPQCQDYFIFPIAFIKETGYFYWIHIFMYDTPTIWSAYPVTYYIINPSQPVFGDVTGTTTAYLPFAVLFDNNWSWQIHEPNIYPISFTLRVIFPQCYIEQDYTFTEAY